MAIVNVVRYENRPDEVVGKYVEDDIRLGSQLIVYPAQTAFFVRGGKILDEFTSGTHTINSENIPLLNKIINMPFGKESPFAAEVWFVNQSTILDCKWGTAAPLQIEDPMYCVIVPVRAYGQYGFRISKPRVFLEGFVGNMPSFDVVTLSNYFRGVIQSRLSSIVSDAMLAVDASVVNIGSKTTELSDIAQKLLQPVFEKYGVELQLFTVIAITVDEGDASFKRLKEAIDAKAEMRIIGSENYQMRRSFDVLEKAAGNTGGGAMNAAVGIGAGVGIGSQVAGLAGTFINTQSPVAPPPVPQAQYYVVIAGAQQGPFDMASLQAMIQQGTVNENTLVWKAGMPQWSPLSSLGIASAQPTPPPIPKV